MLSRPTLRPYQRDAIAAVHDRYAAGDRATLLVLPTGTGKTVVFAHHVAATVERGGRALILAHRTELLTQAQGKLRDAGVWAELEQAKRRAGMAPAVVASVQTLRGARLEAFPRDWFDDVVIDEAHHARASTYEAIVEHFETARILGVTATPDRLDGKGLGELFQSCAYRYELRQAIADGYLAPIRARRIDVEGIDLSTVKTRAGDFAQNELGEIMAAEEALHGVAQPLLEQAGDRRTIVFGVDVAHAHGLAEMLNRYEPGVARAVDGTASEQVRAGALEAFRAGWFRILVNCALFTEGFDEPSIACVAIARPTKSRALYTQMVGRGTRLAEGKGDCLVLDFTGQAGRHRLIGPADVLAGRELDDEVRGEVERQLGAEQLELEELLDQVEADVQRRREQAGPIAVAKYIAHDFDPFVGELPEVEMAEAWSREPATPNQLRALGSAGLEKLPDGLSKADASRMIEAISDRRRRGLCTYKMARLLGRNGVDAREMSFAEAGKQIQLLRERWSAQRSRRQQAFGGGDFP